MFIDTGELCEGEPERGHGGGGTKDMVAKHVCQFQQKQNLTQILRFIHNINGNATRCV